MMSIITTNYLQNFEKEKKLYEISDCLIARVIEFQFLGLKSDFSPTLKKILN